MNPMLMTDFYKVSHPFQYPKGTTKVYSNLTARKSRLPGVDSVVFFGLQYFILEYLHVQFNVGFFDLPKDKALAEYRRMVKNTVGDLPTYKHIEDLWELGYLPIKIKAVPEGTSVPIGTPMLTIVNTHPDFFWVTNFLESLMSAMIWQPITSATLAREYRKVFTDALSSTIGDTSFVDFMGHDFSFRGMGGLESAVLSGMGHLLSFKGTDTIPAIMGLETYYGADVTKELVGCSVPATEHSVMSSGTSVDGEFETFKRLITEIYPNGIVSIVSDTFDLWEVLNSFLPRLKNEILARDGKVVIRPDSGDPVDIICGDLNSDNANERKGVIELLWDTFGGTLVNGYRVLDPHIGAIYGDSITIDRAKQITSRLKSKGFAPIIVYGIGSYTYQYNTRDTFGMAVKCTAIWNNGKLVPVFKDPVTDDGTKKSLRGLLRVDENLKVWDNQTEEQEAEGILQTVYEDGQLLVNRSLSEIRSIANV